jgi:hypothetical protein
MKTGERKTVVMKRTGVVLFGLLVLGTGVLGIWRTATAAAIVRVTEVYVQSLVAGEDTERINQTAVGNAAHLAENRTRLQTSARVERIETDLAALGSGWARVFVTIELTLADDSQDVGWYTADVIKEEKNWKVAGFREREPEVAGRELLPPVRAEAEELEQLLAEFLAAAAEQQWSEAKNCLAGRARRNQELAAPVLARGVPVGPITGLRCQTIYLKGKTAVVRANYQLEGRQAEILVYGYKTTRGWRIVDIMTR